MTAYTPRDCPKCGVRKCVTGTGQCAMCALTPTPAIIPLGYCDAHPSSRAAALWERDVDQLTFCAHCSREYGPTLRANGWRIGATNLTAWQTQAPANA